MKQPSIEKTRLLSRKCDNFSFFVLLQWSPLSLSPSLSLSPPPSFLPKNSHQPLLDLPVQPAQVLDVRGARDAPVLGEEAGEGAGRQERRLLGGSDSELLLLGRGGRRAHREPGAAAEGELLE